MRSVPCPSRFWSMVAAVAIALMGAPEASAQQRALTLVSFPGTLPGADQASAVLAVPGSSASAVSRALASRPSGTRVLLLDGFADDLAHADVITVPPPSARSVPSPRSPLSCPSPWLDRGTERVRSRVAVWLLAYGAAQGVAPDLVVVRCRETMSSGSYLPRISAAGWSAIAADRRFTALAASVGVPYLKDKIFSNSGARAARAAWDRYFEGYVDACLGQAILAPLQKQFPAACICMESRYRSTGGLSTVSARNGAPVAASQVPISLARLSPSALDGFRAASTIVSDLRKVGPASSLVPGFGAPGSAQWIAGSAGSALAASWQAEVARHLAVSGVRFAWTSAAGWNTADGRLVRAAISGANLRIGDAAGGPAVAPSVPRFDAAAFFASGGVRGGRTTWRISMAAGIQAAVVTFGDGSAETIQREPDGCGAWLSCPASRQLASIDVPSSSAAPQFVVLSDSLPDTAAPGAAPAGRYMIVYQSVDPQSYLTGKMDPAKVVAGVRQEIEAGRGSEWGVLDFEDPFNEILDRGPSDPRYAESLDSLVAALKAVKAAFPAVRWTYYNFPRLPYWNAGRDWSSLAPEEGSAIKESVVSRFGPLMDQVDWFMPSIYDRYERALFSADMRSLIAVSESSFRDATVTFLRDYMSIPGKVRRPIVPMASPWFIEGGRATRARAVPIDELVSDQLKPAVAAGADGIALWCIKDWMGMLATRDCSDLAQWIRDDQAIVRAQFAMDFLGGVSPTAFDWSSPANVATVRAALDGVVSGALQAVQRVGADRGPSTLSPTGTASSAASPLDYGNEPSVVATARTR